MPRANLSCEKAGRIIPMIELHENTEFEQVYAKFKDKVARYICGKIPNEHDAEDLASDVFVKVFNGLSGFDEKKASLSTWIYKITQNAVIDYYRKAKLVCELPEEICFDENIDEKMLNEETLKSLADALGKLSSRERDIIILHYYSGKTLKSIAEKMDISYSYVKLLHTNALKALRETINE